MEIKSFVANSAIEAVSKIREELGPQAMVLEIRQIKPSGIARIFQKPKIEVLAYKPAEDDRKEETQLNELKRELSTIKTLIEEKIKTVQKEELRFNSFASPEGFPFYGTSNYLDEPGITERKDWRIDFLQRLGIEALYARTIVEDISGGESCEALPTPIEARRLIEQLKRFFNGKQTEQLPEGVHIFIGSPGCGKSTFLCKLLSRIVFAQSSPARVIQMDAVTANTSELPALYCEILGIPFTRNFISDVDFEKGYVFVDLPGVDWQNRVAIEKLSQVLAEFRNPHIHLVLNLCYDTRLLIAQARAFSSINISDLVFTHIDEGALLGKIFNLVLGTNYTVGFLSGGQNIPGEIYSNNFDVISQRLFPS
ncbi:MAG: hypothetical protein ACP5MG_11205 [Verrucomicrobiia bacterium]